LAVLISLLMTTCTNDRVSTAYADKFPAIQSRLQQQGIAAGFQVFFRVFKQEKTLELWVKGHGQARFTMLATYPICKASGLPGPKRKEGDQQVPEGFYFINRFNPKSQFHLSLGLNYPNESDLRLSDRDRPGGDIFIHGGCESIGCMAMTDDSIKEIYVIASEAKKHGQSQIPVHIFPVRMDGEGFDALCAQQAQLKDFWLNLKAGYDLFEAHAEIPTFVVDENGLYQFTVL
jgi:murein L,D-transpeptidase YafK